MSVYRRKYKVKRKGQVIEGVSRFYTVEFTDPDGNLVRKSTKCTTRRAAEAAEVEMRKSAEGVHAGLVDPAEARRPIGEQIDEFTQFLLKELHRDADYCRITNSRLTLLAKDAGWRRLADVNLPSFESWRRSQGETKRHGRTPKPKTINQFLDIARRFMDWAVKRGKARGNPLKNAEKASVVDNRNYRRAGTHEEFGKLLKAVEGDRKRFYRWAVYVPLRRESHGQLTWGDIHESDKRPWVAIRAETIKDRKYIPLPLRADVAAMMKAWRAELKPKETDRVFPNIPRVRDMEADFKKAGVVFKDAKGLRRLDLHAFRKTALKWMKQAGVTLEDAAAILQHKDIRTTKRYYDEEPDPMALDVVEKMPSIPEGGE
jgi:site-specific recombinase XerD